MSMSAAAELRSVRRALAQVERSLRRVLRTNPKLEIPEMSQATDALRALAPRIDAVANAVSTDTATAVAAAVAPLNEQINTLQGEATNVENEVAGIAGDLGNRLAAVEQKLGITPAA